ncbi:MAG TPA: ABC transporter permease [Usitatibacter sp.]|nr:ABC transporter permease [Usitatibacter sp.]
MNAPAARRPPQRWLVYELLRREISRRYAGSVSGLAWTLLQPLAQLAIFSLVFSLIFRATVPAAYPGVSYMAFVAVALWPWIMFSEAIQQGMASVAANAGLIRKVALPSEVFVYAAVGACCAVHLAGFIGVLVVLRIAGEAIHLSGIPLAVLLLLPYALLAGAIALVLAALQTLLKDVEHATGLVLSIVFYATPILYPLTLVPPAWRGVFSFNPLAYLTGRLRDALLGEPSLRLADLAVLAACGLAFALALWVFRRLSPYFEDFL